FGQKITAAEVHQSLRQLMPILRWYVEEERPDALGQKPDASRPPKPQTSPTPQPATIVRPENKLAIVPKGLRSFDAKDADFFLDLLPCPRDQEGLPQSNRFWKHAIEDANELTFIA